MLITHNMKNKKLLLGIAWAWLTCLSANAEVKLPAFFSDGMVMQQQTRANLWGTATPNAPIIRKSKFPQNPKRSVRFSGKRTKRSVQKRKARNTQKAETKVL